MKWRKGWPPGCVNDLLLYRLRTRPASLFSLSGPIARSPGCAAGCGRARCSRALLARPLYADAQWQAEPGRFLWRGGRRSGRFLVENGRRVILQRNPAAEAELLGFHFIRSVLAALLRQRGLLTLHASAVATPSGVIAVCGRSGAGKSTTVSALMARDNPLLADDLMALSFAPDGGVQALPGVPQLYLCEDAMQGLEPDTAALPFRSYGRLKLAIRPQREIALQAM